MNKNAIKSFATWARTELIDQVSQRAYQYGITREGYGEASAVTVRGRALSADEQRQRKELVRQLQQKGYAQVMEEVAYTWFNRFIALRFMEVNNYLPSHVRVFSDSTGAFKPEILNDALHLELPGLDADKVEAYIESNQTETLYRYLLLTQCNALNEALPRMFECMGSYTELLLPNNILKPDGVLGRMVTDIPEEDWTDAVQIIGWLYQYYNAELKDDTFALLKKNVKITKERIPSATQLFTPDWIVRYMVENSLGRLWLEGHPNDELHDGWKYYLDEAQQEPEVQKQLEAIRAEYAALQPEDIKLIDPCMGSGHILVYAFDVLMQIYASQGYAQRDAAQSILANNLFGLDIDDRAAQLAYFAVMMKARQYDRRIFSRGIQPNIYAIVESNGLDGNAVDYFTNNDPKLIKAFAALREELRDAKEYGSILKISRVDFAALYARVDEVRGDISVSREAVLNSILPLIQVAETMAQKYDVVVTNPPYMGSSGMSAKLAEFVKKHYPDSKSDLFAVFMERCGQMAAKNGYQAMITQHAWMFLSSFEKLRGKLLLTDLVNMVHLGARAFEEIGGEVVQTTSFVIRKSHVADYKGEYCRLIEPTTQQGKEDMFLAGENRYAADQSNFSKIPGSPVAYWMSERFAKIFLHKEKVGDFCFPKQGLHSGNNAVYFRFWYEPRFIDIMTDESTVWQCEKSWAKLNKGGAYRKWYGNREYVIFWRNNGDAIKSNGRSVGANNQLFLQNMVGFTDITSYKPSFRYYGKGFVFDVSGPSMFNKENVVSNCYLLGLLNSKVCDEVMSVLSPTIHMNQTALSKISVVQGDGDTVTRIVQTCIDASCVDWDAYETSWDFRRNPLV